MAKSASTFVNYSLDIDDNSPLLLASNSSNVEVLRLLLCHGACIDHQNSDGYTALHVAAMNGCVEATRLLLQYGADPLKEDNDGLTPVDWTEEEGHWECHELLQDYLSWEPEADVEESVCEAFVTMVLDTTSSEGPLDTTPDSPVHSTTMMPDTPGSSPALDMTPGSSDQTFYSAVMPEDTSSNDSPGQLSPSTPDLKGQLCQPLDQPTHSTSSQGNCSSTTPKQHISTANEGWSNPHPPIPTALLQLSNQQLFQQLRELRECPGPVTDSTRQAYLIYLSKIKSGIQPSGNVGIHGEEACTFLPSPPTC